MNELKEIAEVLKNIHSAAIFTHMRPDGDTVGSGMALAAALEKRGVKCELLNEGALPACFSHLEGAERFRTKPALDAEAYIAVDTSAESRLGFLEPVFRAGARKKITVNVDHHISNTRFAKYNFVRERSANCENIAELITLMGVPYTKEIATYLMAGLLTDSGNFSHGDVTGETFRLAASLVDAGADVSELGYRLLRERTLARAGLYAATIGRIRYLLDGKLAIAVVSQNDLTSRGLATDATEGIVDFALTVDSVEVSACLLEMKAENYKVSLRSKGVDVNAVAAMFGGGGHVLASGCMLFGPLEEVIERLTYAVSCGGFKKL